jgi:hypothetical protein
MGLMTRYRNHRVYKKNMSILPGRGFGYLPEVNKWRAAHGLPTIHGLPQGGPFESAKIAYFVKGEKPVYRGGYPEIGADLKRKSKK